MYIKQKEQNKIIRPIDGIKRPLNRQTANQRKDYFKSIAYFGFKVTGVALISVMFLVTFSSVGSTVSYFNDIEFSNGNRLQAGLIGFNLFGGYENEEEEIENVGHAYFDANVSQSDRSLPLVYTVTGELHSGNPVGCEQMKLTADFNGFHYKGLVNELNALATTTMGEWDFWAVLPKGISNLPPNALCRGEIVFKVGLAEVDDDLTHTFSDLKKYPFEVYNWEEEIIFSSFAPTVEENLVVESPTEAITTNGTTTETIVEAEIITPEPIPEPEVVTESVEDSSSPSTEEAQSLAPPPVEESSQVDNVTE
jgi:hypothetical protein